VAQQGRKKRPSGSSPAGKAGRPSGQPGAKPTRVPASAQRTAVGAGPKGSALRTEATTGRKPGSNRTQLVIWGAAITVMLVVVVVGIVINLRNNSTENDGYGTATRSTAAMDANGTITVGTGSPAASFDVYEDPMCPYCAQFDRQYGQQIAQAVDEGKVAVRYHLLNFLDRASGSGNYSTRATAALMCAATDLGPTPGAWAALHTRLFEEDVQPEENSVSDMTNEQLAQYVVDAGVGAGLASDAPPVTAAVDCINSGEMMPMVTTAFNASSAALDQLVGGVRSPVIAHNGAEVDIDDSNWLATVTG
jgi:protein-disulfide isomerase